jgi:hypothetical protein
MRLLLALVSILGLALGAWAISKELAVERSIRFYTSQATTNNAFGPYPNFPVQVGPFLTKSSVWEVDPPGFLSRTNVGKRQILNALAGVGIPLLLGGQGFGILNITINEVNVGEYNGLTETAVDFDKTLVNIPTSNTTGTVLQLTFSAKFRFNSDGTYNTITERVDDMCTLCVFQSTVLFFGINVCSFCGGT